MNNYTINNDGEFESDDPSLPYGADLIQLWLEDENIQRPRAMNTWTAWD